MQTQQLQQPEATKVKQVRALNKEPSSLGERKALYHLLDRMSPQQRRNVVANCSKHAVSFGQVRKTDLDNSTGAIFNDLTCLTVLYGVSWERVNLIAEAVYRKREKP